MSVSFVAATESVSRSSKKGPGAERERWHGRDDSFRDGVAGTTGRPWWQDLATRLATDGSGCCGGDLTQPAFTGSGDVQGACRGSAKGRQSRNSVAARTSAATSSATTTGPTRGSTTRHRPSLGNDLAGWTSPTKSRGLKCRAPRGPGQRRARQPRARVNRARVTEEG